MEFIKKKEGSEVKTSRKEKEREGEGGDEV